MLLRIASISLICLLATNANAQEGAGEPAVPYDKDAVEPAEAEPAEVEPAAMEPAAAQTPAPTPAAANNDGNRGFRNGFSLSVGQESGTINGTKFTGQLYGTDWRIGTGITNEISVYLHSHLSFGTAEIGSTSGSTGNIAVALVGEYLLPMRLFVGAGGGYGVLNNPSGPLAEVRVGYYPFKNSSKGKARRLNVAFDARYYFIEEGATKFTVSHYALSLGYDRF